MDNIPSISPLYYKNILNKKIVEINIDLLVPILGPFYTDFIGYRTSKRFTDLKDDIEKNGIKEPVIVMYEFLKKDLGKYTILEGIHRYTIAKLLGYKTMKCVVQECELDWRTGNLVPSKVPLGIITIDIDKIIPSIHEHSKEKTRELREIIMREGITDPIIVMIHPDNRIQGKYLIKDGNHRYHIAKSLGYKDILCRVVLE